MGYEDECWWSRFEQPRLHAWTADEVLKLQEKERSKADTEAKAVCCYGLLRRETQKVLLRFVDGRPVSQMTTDFLSWVCQQLARDAKRVLALVWDNASWHKSQKVRRWIKSHNREVKRSGGVRILALRLPIKSPWLNPIEPRWVHAKRAVAEAERTLAATELITRVCEYFGSERHEHLKQHVP